MRSVWKYLAKHPRRTMRDRRLRVAIQTRFKHKFKRQR